MNGAAKKEIEAQKLRSQQASLLRKPANKKQKNSLYEDHILSTSRLDSSQQNSSFF